jgi:hypothetical protein
VAIARLYYGVGGLDFRASMGPDRHTRDPTPVVARLEDRWKVRLEGCL